MEIIVGDLCICICMYNIFMEKAEKAYRTIYKWGSAKIHVHVLFKIWPVHLFLPLMHTKTTFILWESKMLLDSSLAVLLQISKATHWYIHKQAAMGIKKGTLPLSDANCAILMFWVVKQSGEQRMKKGGDTNFLSWVFVPLQKLEGILKNMSECCSNYI